MFSFFFFFFLLATDGEKYQAMSSKSFQVTILVKEGIFGFVSIYYGGGLGPRCNNDNVKNRKQIDK